MADVTLGKKIGYQSPFGVEPVAVLNGTDTVTLGFVADYSKIILTKTTAAGVSTVYEAALTLRS